MPQPRPVKEECCLRTMKDSWKNEWVKCMASEAQGNSNQDHHQLTQEEMTGRASLMKRVAEGEVHVGQSDKGKRIVVMDMETYYQCPLSIPKKIQKLTGDN